MQIKRANPHSVIIPGHSRTRKLPIEATLSLFLFSCAFLVVACSAAGDNAPEEGFVCPVTQANGSTPPGEQPSRFHHGNGELWTVLWPDGKVLVSPDNVAPDGWLGMKFPWFRAVEGELVIEGLRLDGDSPPLRAEVPAGYGNTGLQASGLFFPEPGCWQVTGKVGSAQLSFVTQVILDE